VRDTDIDRVVDADDTEADTADWEEEADRTWADKVVDRVLDFGDICQKY
jgi:hypothetical protein